MCLACEEEAFYRAYLDHMTKKTQQEAASRNAGADAEPVCNDAAERASHELNSKQ